MKYKKKIRNLIKKKEKKKKSFQVNEESKIKMNNHQKNNAEFKINHNDLKYFRNNPALKNFFERYRDITLMKIQNIPKLKDKEKRKEIFEEISESLNLIKMNTRKNQKINKSI